MDIFDRIRQERGPLGQHARDTHGYFTFPKLEGEISNRMTFRGKELLVWSINNYLGLANHPEIRKVDAEAAAEWGMGYPMGARMMSGQTAQHEALEQELADFMQKEDAFLLNFGYQGCQSAIEALVSRHDVIVYDSESHACMVDGVRLHQGKRFVFQHNDMDSFEKQLVRAKNLTDQTGGGILVVTEGVFGMAGDQGKLAEICKYKDEYKFRLFVFGGFVVFWTIFLVFASLVRAAPFRCPSWWARGSVSKCCVASLSTKRTCGRWPQRCKRDFAPKGLILV